MLIELRAASLNHLDLWIRKGLPSVPKPRILGADGAGIRRDTGARVVINPGIEHGGRISVVGEHSDGTHAELVAVPRDERVSAPRRDLLRGAPPPSRSSSRPPTGCS